MIFSDVVEVRDALPERDKERKRKRPGCNVVCCGGRQCKSFYGHTGSGQGSGRAVVGRPGSNQVSGWPGSANEGQQLGARFSIGARHNLATKVMSNGVEVIVAGKCGL